MNYLIVCNLPLLSFPSMNTVETVFSTRLPDNHLDSDCPVLPRVIAAACPRPQLSVRQYISFGQICVICLNSIVSASDAHLTSCGHGFHASCLAAAHSATARRGRQITCPICRGRMGLDIDYLRDRYNDDLGSIDAIENFWIKYPNIAPNMCAAQRSTQPHALGCMRSCMRCMRYRNTGEM